MLIGVVGRQGQLLKVCIIIAAIFSLTVSIGCAPARADCISKGPYLLSGYHIALPSDVRRNFEVDGDECFVGGVTPVSWLTIGPYLDLKGLEGAGFYLRSGKQAGLEMSLLEMKKYATKANTALKDIASAKNPQNPATATYFAPPFEVVSCSKTALYDVHHKSVGHQCKAYLRFNQDLIVEVNFLSGAWPPSRWFELGSNASAFAKAHFRRARI